MQEFKKSLQENFEGNLELTRLYVKEFGIIKKDEVIINSSRLFHFAMIGIFAVFIVVLYILVKYFLKQDYISNSEISIKTETLMIILFLLSCIRPVYFIIRKAQLLQINKTGIKLKDNMITWDDIISTHIERRWDIDRGNTYYISIKVKNNTYKLPLTEGEENIRKVSHIVETFRLRYGQSTKRDKE